MERKGVVGEENGENKGLKLGKQSLCSHSWKYRGIQEAGVVGKPGDAVYRQVVVAWMESW